MCGREHNVKTLHEVLELCRCVDHIFVDPDTIFLNVIDVGILIILSKMSKSFHVLRCTVSTFIKDVCNCKF